VKPIAKTVVKTIRTPAAEAKKVRAALDSIDTGHPTIAQVEAVLAGASKLPYGDDADERTSAEWQALVALADLDPDAARRLWEQLVDSWSAHAPTVGGTGWLVLSRMQARLAAKLSSKLRARVRTAWAFGVLSKVFQYTRGTSVPKAPRGGSAAWRQGCIEITLQSFERARACVDAVHADRGFAYSAKCLDIMLRREQGDTDGAVTSYRELVALARKRKQYRHWEVIAALFVVLGLDDEELAREITASWKTTTKKAAAGELSIFES